jgi:periplasmic protein TonB
MGHADILDQPEPLGRSFVFAIGLHLSVVAAVIGLNVVGHRKPEMWGDPQGGGMGSVTVTPVAKIPLPSRGGLVNPVANDTESRVPEPPEKTKPSAAEREPDPSAIAIKSRRAKERERRAASTQNKWRAQQKGLPNQVYSSAGQAMSSPMVGMTGGGGVGVGNNSPFGNRFGAYAELLRRQVAQKWNTSDLDARLRTAPSVTVQFTIRRDGSVPPNSVRIVQRSGIAALDYSTQRAIYDATPFPPLPPGFERNEAIIEFVFELRR